MVIDPRDQGDGRNLADLAERRVAVAHQLRARKLEVGAPYVVFQLAEVAVPRALFAEILRRIERLRPRPPLPT